MPDLRYIEELKGALRERFAEYNESYVKPCRKIRKILEDTMYPDLETLSISLTKLLRAPEHVTSHVDELHVKTVRSQIKHLERHIQNFRKLMARLAVEYRRHEEDIRYLREGLVDEVGARKGILEFLRMTTTPEHKIKGVFVMPEVLDLDDSDSEPSDADSVQSDASEVRSVDESDNSSLDGFVVKDSDNEDPDESYDPSDDA